MDNEWKPKSTSISLSLRKRRPKSTTKKNASQSSSQSSQRSLTSLSSIPSPPVAPQPPIAKQPPSPQPSTTQPSTSSLSTESSHLQDYQCPLCSQDLSHLRSSYLRQSHVDKCLTESAASESNTPTTPSSTQDEFMYCIFCGKDISTYQGLQKDIHFGRCLDQLGEMDTSTYAGNTVPLIDELTACPVCHESTHCNRRTTTKRKLQHIKTCVRSKNMSMNTLLQKLRWIQWGHKPIERTPTPLQPLPSAAATAAAAITPQRPTTMHVTEVAEDDDDFSTHVMFQRRPNDPQQQRNLAAADAMDEELQLALAISRSQAEMELNNNMHQRPLNIIDPNESRQVAKAKLHTMAAHTPTNASIQYSIKPLSPSRLQQRSSDTTPYWDLAATHGQECTYLSKFLINLHHHPSS